MENIEALYRSYQLDVYRFLLSVCGDPHLAEELTQETFFRAIDGVTRFRGDCSVKSWLFQIARHLWYQELSRRKRRPVVPLSEELTAPSDPARDYLRREELREFYEKIDRLPEAMRTTALLRLSGGLSFREIGEAMGKTETWARVTFYRAKQKLLKGADQG